MPPRSRIQLLAGMAACAALCAGAAGCQTDAAAVGGYPAAGVVGLLNDGARPVAAANETPPSGTVISSSSQYGVPPRPPAAAASLGEPTSTWRPAQRVGADKAAPNPPVATAPGSPGSGSGAVPASIEVPVAEPIAVAVANAPPGEPTTVPPPPRLEPQPAVVVPGPVAVLGHPEVPREFAKRPLPPYVVEPPDILLVSAGKDVTLEGRPIDGQHLVRPDGTIGLGTYGNVYVAGLTLEEVRDAVAAQIHLSVPGKDVDTIKKLLVVDVLAYNSKVYYVITDGGGYGEQVYPIPITGNETVLDALSKINGLPPVASKKRIWVARATPDCNNPQILPVDWCGITQRGFAATNYQIMPNDRVYVASDKWISASTWLRKRLDPVQQVLGATLLGSSTVNSIRVNGKIAAGSGVP